MRRLAATAASPAEAACIVLPEGCCGVAAAWLPYGVKREWRWRPVLRQAQLRFPAATDARAFLAQLQAVGRGIEPYNPELAKMLAGLQAKARF